MMPTPVTSPSLSLGATPAVPVLTDLQFQRLLLGASSLFDEFENVNQMCGFHLVRESLRNSCIHHYLWTVDKAIGIKWSQQIYDQTFYHGLIATSDFLTPKERRTLQTFFESFVIVMSTEGNDFDSACATVIDEGWRHSYERN